jgi:DnaK suppressor protein
MKTERARQLLTEERARLTEALQGVQRGIDSQTDSSELSTYDQHPGDMGSETFEREKDLSILESLEASIADVDAALQRLDDGDYGRCEVCGREIGDERLEARPMARFCVEHQAATEAVGR